MSSTENLPYHITDRDLVSDTDGLRVQVMTVADGEVIPWHYHSNVTDIFVGLEGTTVVETKAPQGRHELPPGVHLAVPPKTAHQVTPKDAAGCRFTLIQGVGDYDYCPVGGGSMEPVE